MVADTAARNSRVKMTVWRVDGKENEGRASRLQELNSKPPPARRHPTGEKAEKAAEAASKTWPPPKARQADP